uniref:Uncharacterized protein n=1 Tax=Lactuca sativa TaxID=4236 RepID=A0A9R1XRQ4_LACSA|nr:hypothetical protein LSAT_V11C300133980 [Lactuca sativa]
MKLHDYNNFNVKGIVNLKRSGCNIWEVFEVLDGVRRDIFKDIVFGYLLDIPRLQGDGLLFYKMFLHQIRTNVVLSPDGIKWLYFRVCDTKMKLMIPMQLDFVWGSYLWDITYDDLEDTWNKMNKYLSLPERRQTLKYSVSGFTTPIRMWMYEMLPAVHACGFGQPPRQNMLPSDGEMTSCYYMSFQEYVYSERKSFSSPIRDHFRRQDESSSSMSSSDRSHGRGRGSGKHNLEEVLKRLHILEQHVFTNREPREELEERNDNAGNKFDDGNIIH